MANALFEKFRNNQLGKGSAAAIDFDGATDLKFALQDHAGGDGAPDIAADDFYDDVDGSLVGALSTALSSVTVGVVAVGVVDAADLAPAFTAVSGASVESIVALKDTAVASTSPLFGYWDTATGLPLTPNGGDVNVTLNASGIFKF
jgi:hypothetical protein